MAWWNPFKPKPTANIREQAPDRSRALQQLQESLSNQPDLFASLLDRYYSNDSWWFPVNGVMPAIGATSNKMYGADRYAFYTEQDLRFQRDACRLLFAHEPVAKAIEGHLNAFVIGKGMSYKICPKKDFSEEYNTPEGEKRLRQYQQAIDEWLDEQQWPEREQECYTCKVVDGEFFLWVTMRTGKVTVRRLEPEHIQNPVGKTYLDGWYLGVKIDLKDAETPLAYGYKPDGVAWQEIPAKQIIHYKANVTRNVSRGISDFYPVTDDLKSISQLLDNIRDGAMARAEIAYMWSVKNATPAAIAAFADDKADRSRINSITGKTNRSKGQQSGKAVAHGDNVEFTTMPQGDVEGSVAALQASLRMVGNRFCMPEYMVSADASNANYASTQMAGTPFVRKVEIEQSLLKRPFKQILTMVMQQAVVKGIIPTSEYAKLDIEIECGSPVIEDEYQQAQMYDIMKRNGVISPQKWCMAKGLDYEEVQRDLNEWNESNMQAPDLGQQAGGTAFNAQQQDKQNEYDAQQNEPVKEGYEDSYGRCPICGGECKTRERRINGYDTCVNGHKYLSRDAVHEPVQENVLDSSGHLHKGKGVGGGQFTGKGDGGNNNRPIPLHKGANMKTQKHPIDSESQQQYLVNKYGASGYRVHNLKYAMPKESKSTWTGDESGTMGGVSSFANFGNAVDDIIFGASESVTGDNYSSQLRNDGGKVGLLVLMGKVKDGPGSEVVIKAAKIAAVVTEEELEQIFKVAVKEDLTRSAEAGENGVKPEDADKMTVKALLEKYSFDGGDRDAIFGRMEELLKEKLAKG